VCKYTRRSQATKTYSWNSRIAVVKYSFHFKPYVKLILNCIHCRRASDFQKNTLWQLFNLCKAEIWMTKWLSLYVLCFLWHLISFQAGTQIERCVRGLTWNYASVPASLVFLTIITPTNCHRVFLAGVFNSWDFYYWGVKHLAI